MQHRLALPRSGYSLQQHVQFYYYRHVAVLVNHFTFSWQTFMVWCWSETQGVETSAFKWAHNVATFNISHSDHQQAKCRHTSWGQSSSGALLIKSLLRPQRWSRMWWSAFRSTEQRTKQSHHRHRCLMCRASRCVCVYVCIEMLSVVFEYQTLVIIIICLSP